MIVAWPAQSQAGGPSVTGTGTKHEQAGRRVSDISLACHTATAIAMWPHWHHHALAHTLQHRVGTPTGGDLNLPSNCASVTWPLAPFLCPLGAKVDCRDLLEMRCLFVVAQTLRVPVGLT
jgi:hypothetical protein